MVTGAEIALGYKALKSALGILKDIRSLTDATAIQDRVIQLNGLMMDAQESAIAAREDHARQEERIKALEKEIEALKDWGAERLNYELKCPEPGVNVFMPKPAARGDQPPHWLCPTCYGNGVKSFLQFQGSGKDMFSTYKCGTCGNTVATHMGTSPQWIG